MACELSYPKIPDELASYAEAIKSTIKQSIKFELSVNSKLKKWQSKVGGIPYLPLGEQYPVNSDGDKLLFLAQLNFTELPYVEELPKEGIVEFFIDGNDDLMGLQDLHNGFKVLYFKDIIEDDSKLHDNLCENVTFDVSPFERTLSFSMSFSVENQYIPISDYRFKKIIADFDGNWEMYETYAWNFPANGHRIGGYPFFTQTDPRLEPDYELLLQIDSDIDIMWGDMGGGAFFIKPNDLKELNFTDVIYNWECV